MHLHQAQCNYEFGLNNVQFSRIMKCFVLHHGQKKGPNRMAEGCAVDCVTAWPISRHPLINSSLAFTVAQPHSSADSLASISSGVKKLWALLKCFGLHINDQRKQPPMTAKHAGLAQFMSDIIVNLKKIWNTYADRLKECVWTTLVSRSGSFCGFPGDKW